MFTLFWGKSIRLLNGSCFFNFLDDSMIAQIKHLQIPNCTSCEYHSIRL